VSKLPVVSAREVIRVAEMLGFAFDRQKDSHAVYMRDSDNRRLVIPVHKGRDLKPGTLRGLIDDMGLSVDEFVERLCPAGGRRGRVPAAHHRVFR
jgi:predicted RNA binding protein YcfA (HicA-like mRNA interferase family)